MVERADHTADADDAAAAATTIAITIALIITTVKFQGKRWLTATTSGKRRRGYEEIGGGHHGQAILMCHEFEQEQEAANNACVTLSSRHIQLFPPYFEFLI